MHTCRTRICPGYPGVAVFPSGLQDRTALHGNESKFSLSHIHQLRIRVYKLIALRYPSEILDCTACHTNDGAVSVNTIQDAVTERKMKDRFCRKIHPVRYFSAAGIDHGDRFILRRQIDPVLMQNGVIDPRLCRYPEIPVRQNIRSAGLPGRTFSKTAGQFFLCRPLFR